MFDPDLIVAWMAEHQSGNLSRLVKNVEWAASRDRKAARSWVAQLQRLGIADIDWQADRWKSRSCVLTPLPGNLETTLLSGARPVIAEEYISRGAVVHREPSPDWQVPYPSTVWWHLGRPGERDELAESLGIRSETCAADRIAHALPRLKPGPPTSPPTGREADWFNPASLSFERIEVGARPRNGLYKGLIDGNRTRYAIFDGHDWYRSDRWEGAYFVLSPNSHPLVWRSESRYRTSSSLGTLVVGRRMHLPAAHAEAAILCTGLPPRLTGQTTEYDGVPFRIAEKIARSLRRKLETT
ncbi:hypothetical protein OG828_30845 [Streptomyces sp. NBC_00457]|uniref:hypothetical protein n=1 Tax=Streptomyces sp. NBC_00457 TaxID=2975748 RepID=UPI002E221AE3